MRTLASLISLTLLAPTGALAEPAPSGAPAMPAPTPPATAAASPGPLEPIDMASITDACKPLAKQALPNPPVAAAPVVQRAPAAAASRPALAPAARAAALSARVSLASCMVDQAVAPLQLCDCGDSVVAVDAAAGPGFAILDGVIAMGDPANQLLAEHTKGQRYAGFATRLQATLPKLGPDATDAETALRDMRKQTLEAQLAPWHEAAKTAFQQVVDMARAHPELSANPAIATAVRDSEQHLAADVASR